MDVQKFLNYVICFHSMQESPAGLFCENLFTWIVEGEGMDYQTVRPEDKKR